MDDPINVHGTTVKVTEQPDDYTLKGTFVEKQSIGFDLWAEINEIGRASCRERVLRLVNISGWGGD